MLQTNPGFLRLAEFEKFDMRKADLSAESIEKIKDTVRYTMTRDPDQNLTDVLKRCMIAQMAEQQVATHVEGNFGTLDAVYDDPYTWAYDVLAHIKYSGIRIEVKTHQSGSKWIQVNTRNRPPYPATSGINIGPMLEHGVADLLIIFDVKENNDVYTFTPVLLCDKIALTNTDLIKKSNFQGYYINNRMSDAAIENETLTFYKD